MRKSYFIAVVFIFIFLFYLPGLFAGVVRLTNGEEIRGGIIEKTDSYIKININGKVETIEKSRIASIAGKKPIPPSALESDAVSFDNALRLASQGAFLHAEEMFKTLAAAGKGYSDLPSKALEIINDFRNGIITYDYAQALFKGAYYFSQKDFKQVIAIYESALAANPQAVEVYYNLANAYLAMGDAGQAVYYLEKLLVIEPNDVEILFALAVAYQSSSKYKEAVDCFKKLIEFSPSDPEVYSLLASSYYALGKTELGEESFDKAKHLFQENGQLDRAEKIEALLSNLP